MTALKVDQGLLVKALTNYLDVVIDNDGVQAVAEADAGEIGWEILELFENTYELHPDPDEDDGKDVTLFLNLGEAAITACRQLVKAPAP